MEREIIREFLTRLGFTIDEPSARKFFGALDKSAAWALRTSAAVAGIAAATEAAVVVFARGMERMYYHAQRTGSTVSNLRALGFGAEQIGIQAEDSTAAIESMTAALRNNPGLQALLRKFGIGADDPTRQMIGLVRQLRKLPYHVASQYAGLFGMDEGMFRMLTLPGALEKLEEAADRQRRIYRNLNVDQEASARASRDFMNILREMWMTLGGISDKFLIEMLPGFRAFHSSLTSIIQDIVSLDKVTLPEILNVTDKHIGGWRGLAGAINSAALALTRFLGAPESYLKKNQDFWGRFFAYIMGGPNWREAGRSPLYIGPSQYLQPSTGSGAPFQPNALGDKKKLSAMDRLDILLGELNDPDRNPIWDSELRSQILTTAREAGVKIELNQNTEVNVNGGGSPESTARAVGAEQGRVGRSNAAAVRNVLGAVQ